MLILFRVKIYYIFKKLLCDNFFPKCVMCCSYVSSLEVSIINGRHDSPQSSILEFRTPERQLWTEYL